MAGGRDFVTAFEKVVITGAGPVGLSAAMALVNAGIPCVVLEKRDSLSTASKASTFHPPTLEIFDEFGIIEPILEKGQRVDRIQYRRNSGDVVADFELALLSPHTRFPFRLHLEQSEITPLLIDRLEASGLADIRFGAEVLDAGETEDAAWVEVSQNGGPAERIEAGFLLGADGARSTVRDTLGIALQGSSYPGKVLRLIVTEDMAAYLPGLAYISYIFGEDGKSISLLKMPDCWRVIIRLEEGCDAEAAARPEWYMPVVRKFIPNVPERLAVRNYDIYEARKMVAERAGRGRIALIGDALHLTNTRGGMNMNCGIHDAYHVATAIADAEGDSEVPAAAAAERLRIATEDLIPRTDRNVAGGADWLAEIGKVAADRSSAAAYLESSAMLDIAPARKSAPAATQYRA